MVVKTKKGVGRGGRRTFPKSISLDAPTQELLQLLSGGAPLSSFIRGLIWAESARRGAIYGMTEKGFADVESAGCGMICAKREIPATSSFGGESAAGNSGVAKGLSACKGRQTPLTQG